MDYNVISDVFFAIVDSIGFQVALTLLVIITLQFIIRSTIERVVQRVVKGHRYSSAIEEHKREQTLITILRTASAVLLWTVGIIVILWQLEVNIAALMTGAGLLGIVVGFGAQSAIKDFLGGTFILLENQYRVGDIVTLHTGVGDISGLVEDITIRITRLRDLDGNVHIVQNGSINVVTNLSFNYANVNVDVDVAYDSNLDTVIRVINEVGQSMVDDAELGEHIIEPIQFLRVDGFEDSAIRMKALGKVEPAKQWDIAGEFRRRLLPAFADAGITIPFPQVVVHKSAK